MHGIHINVFTQESPQYVAVHGSGCSYRQPLRGVLIATIQLSCTCRDQNMKTHLSIILLVLYLQYGLVQTCSLLGKCMLQLLEFVKRLISYHSEDCI